MSKPMTVRHDLTIWRNDDYYEYPVRVVGLDLTDVALAMEIRFEGDAPGPALVSLLKVTEEVEGVRFLGVTLTDGLPTSQLGIRLDRSTLQSLGYDGVLGDTTVREYALLMGGRTRMMGRILMPAHAYGSDDAPAKRGPSKGIAPQTLAPDPGAIMTLTLDGGVTIEVDSSDLLKNTLGSAIGASEARANDLVQATRDPWRLLQGKLTTLLFGTSIYVNGYPTTTRAVFKIAIVGDSIGASQGASGAYTLPAQITAIFADLLPEVVLEIRVYAKPGSWQAQMAEQIDAMLEDGFVPDLVLIVTGTNDGSTSIYHSLEGPVVFARELAKNIKRFQDMGAVAAVVSKPPPHPTQSLIEGRFDFSPDFFPTVPSTGFVAGDDDFQTLTYSASAQTIATNIPGQFKLYGNGWFAPNQWFRVKEGVFGPDALFCHVADWDVPGTVLHVDDGNGGPVIPFDVVTRKGGWQACINARTQLVPARNENDLSRPAGVPADVLLAVEPRDLNGNGVLIDASLRHLVIERITAEVTVQMAAIRVPFGEEFTKELTSNASYDVVYLKNDGTAIDGYHPNNRGFSAFGRALRQVLVTAMFRVKASMA